MSLGRDGIAGLILLGISLALIIQSLSLPSLPIVPVGPGFYPRIVLGFLALASVALIVQDLMRVRATSAEPAAPRRYGLVVALFAIFGGYLALLPFIGFRIATALFVMVVQVTLERPRSPQQWVLVGAIALGTVITTYLVFERYLLILLPRGTWTGW